MLELLRESPRPVGELVRHTGLTQPGTSKHLRVLRNAGLVISRIEGQQRVYALDVRPLAELDIWLEPYRQVWESSLDALERHLGSTANSNEED
jgi:DNA-binding transcriptional ArsR family regulator